jgi:hypothetical protein
VLSRWLPAAGPPARAQVPAIARARRGTGNQARGRVLGRSCKDSPPQVGPRHELARSIHHRPRNAPRQRRDLREPHARGRERTVLDTRIFGDGSPTRPGHDESPTTGRLRGETKATLSRRKGCNPLTVSRRSLRLGTSSDSRDTEFEAADPAQHAPRRAQHPHCCGPRCAERFLPTVGRDSRQRRNTDTRNRNRHSVMPNIGSSPVPALPAAPAEADRPRNSRCTAAARIHFGRSGKHMECCSRGFLTSAFASPCDTMRSLVRPLSGRSGRAPESVRPGGSPMRLLVRRLLPTRRARTPHSGAPRCASAYVR